MSRKTCFKLEKGKVVYEYDENNRYIQIIDDIPETGSQGGTFSSKKFTFDMLNECLDSFGDTTFIPGMITSFFRIGCSNTGSMLTAILIDCGVVERIRYGEYKAIGRL